MLEYVRNTTDPASTQSNKIPGVATNTWLLWLFVLSMAFDFKSTKGEGFLQMGMAVLNTMVFLALALSYRVALPRRGSSALVFWIFLLLVVVGSVSAFINGVHLGSYIRTMYAFWLFLEGILVVWWIRKNAYHKYTLVQAMTFSAVLSIVFTLIFGFIFSGLTIARIRYQILSPLIPFLLVASIVDLFFMQRRRVWSSIVILVIFAIMMLSVTRGTIIVVGGVGAALMAAWVFRGVRTVANVPKPIIRLLIIGLSLLLVVIGFLFIFSPDVLMRWSHRGDSAVSDVTFWTRVAAVVGQYEKLGTTHLGWLLGAGFGSVYPWPVWQFPWILPFLGHHTDWSTSMPGEFMWATFFYYGGYVLGTIVIGVLFYTLVRAFLDLVVFLRERYWTLYSVRPYWIGIFGYFAFMGTSFTSNPFISRLAALYMGLCLGLVLIARNSTFSTRLLK